MMDFLPTDINNYPEESESPYILCAAIWFKDGIKRPHQPKNIESGIVVCGRRHHNCYITVYGLNEGYVEHLHEANNRAVQGFLTSDDRFVDRKEAGYIAYSTRQISKETDCLFSEDLY
jgi:hypothetical protein